MTDWHNPAPDGVRVRPTARAPLVDQHDCALPCCAAGSDRTPFWFTPGGGAEPDEPPEAAALRQLAEKTGLRQVRLGREIWRRTLRIPFDGELREIRERWFFIRADHFVLDSAGFDQLELVIMTGHRWWTVAELHPPLPAPSRPISAPD